MTGAAPTGAALTGAAPDTVRRTRRSSGLRLLVVVLLVCLTPGLLLVGVLAWLGASEAGTRMLAQQASNWLPQLTLELDAGDLASGLQLHRVQWEEGTFQIEARSVSLSWQPSCLLVSRLCIAHLDIERMEVTLAPSPPDQVVRLPTIATPWPLAIESARLGELIVNYGVDKSARIADATARELALRDDQLSVSKLTLSHSEQPYQVQGQLQLHGDYPLELQLHVKLDDPLPPIVAQLRGSLQEMAYRIDKIDELPLVLEGTVALLDSGLPLRGAFRSTGEFDYPLDDLPFRFRRLAGEFSGNTDALSLTLEGALLTASLVGEQSFELEASVRPADLLIEVQQLQAQIQGYPLHLLGGELAWSSATGLQARKAVLAQGDNHLALDGELYGAGLVWNLNLPEPQVYLPAMAGEIVAQGEFRYHKSLFNFSAALEAKNLGYQQLQLTQAQLECKWQGAALEEPVQLHCNNLLLGAPALGTLPALTWVSKAPVNLVAQWSQPGVSIDPLCLHNRDVPAQKVCSAAVLQLSAQGMAGAELSGHNLPLAWLELLLHSNPMLAGSWNFSLSVPPGPLTSANWVVSSTALGQAGGSLSYSEQGWNGSLSSAGVNLSPLLPMFPELRELSGSLKGEIRFQEDEQGVVLHGLAALEKGHLDLFEMDSIIENINFALRLDGRRATLEGDVTVEDEAVALTGYVDWQTQPWSAELRLLAQNIELEPLAGVVATLSTDLTLSATPEAVSLTGDILVPKARLDATELSSGANVIGISPDTEIVGEKPGAFSGPELDINISLRLGEDVQFQGYGLFGSLRGGLQLEKKGKRAPRARGTIVLANGRFMAYGQDLDVEEGRMEFTGSPYSPDIRLRAHRRHTIDDAEVGIIAQGPIAQPRMRLYSSIAMSDQERMHYLLTGRYIDAASGPSDSAMSDAALAVGLMSANKQVGAFGEQLGIQSFALGAEMGEQGQQAQVSGYFGPNLYLKYGYSLFEQGDVFSARYRLTDQFYVEGYQGVQSALELLWFVRRRQQDEVYPLEEDAELEDSDAAAKATAD